MSTPKHVRIEYRDTLTDRIKFGYLDSAHELEVFEDNPQLDLQDTRRSRDNFAFIMHGLQPAHNSVWYHITKDKIHSLGTSNFNLVKHIVTGWMLTKYKDERESTRDDKVWYVQDMAGLDEVQETGLFVPRHFLCCGGNSIQTHEDFSLEQTVYENNAGEQCVISWEEESVTFVSDPKTKIEILSKEMGTCLLVGWMYNSCTLDAVLAYHDAEYNVPGAPPKVEVFRSQLQELESKYSALFMH